MASRPRPKKRHTQGSRCPFRTSSAGEPELMTKPSSATTVETIVLPPGPTFSPDNWKNWRPNCRFSDTYTNVRALCNLFRSCDGISKQGHSSWWLTALPHAIHAEKSGDDPCTVPHLGSMLFPLDRTASSRSLSDWIDSSLMTRTQVSILSGSAKLRGCPPRARVHFSDRSGLHARCLLARGRAEGLWVLGKRLLAVGSCCCDF